MKNNIYIINTINGSRKFILLGLLVLGLSEAVQAQFKYKNEQALQIIDDIEHQTSFHFLYRDALLADVTLSFSAGNSNLFHKLQEALRFHQLDIDIDSSRHQVIIFRSKRNSAYHKKVTIRGQVVDAKTGERLPFANIRWKKGSNIRGVSANRSGSFYLRHSFTQNIVTFRASYIGYKSQYVSINIVDTEQITELTFRLEPDL